MDKGKRPRVGRLTFYISSQDHRGWIALPYSPVWTSSNWTRLPNFLTLLMRVFRTRVWPKFHHRHRGKRPEPAADYLAPRGNWKVEIWPRQTIPLNRSAIKLVLTAKKQNIQALVVYLSKDGCRVGYLPQFLPTGSFKVFLATVYCPTEL